jgi:hypothetical protein
MLPLLDGLLDAWDRAAHIGQPIGVEKLPQAGLQKSVHIRLLA